MDILIGFAVAALKAGVSGVVGNEIVQALADQGIDIGSDKLSQYLEKAQKELSQVLSDKSLMKINVPEDYIDYIKEEIKGLLRSVSLDEDLFRNCHYDAKSLAEALYKKYKRQKKDFVECESEIQKVLYVMSEKAISLEKEREGFTKDSLVYLMKNEDKKMKILHTLDEFMKTRIADSENGREPQRKKRLPDRTEEYRRKWNENMFLNDFDEDDENAGVNIPLYKLYQLPFYRLKNQKTDLSNLEERLDKCVQGQDIKNRMLLILGQAGMGKSTMITWFVHRYQEKQDVDKKEILVYRFTDLDVEWSFQINGERKRESSIDDAILESLNMKREELEGKLLILDGFDEVVADNDRIAILNRLYNAWVGEARIKDFSLLITCRENYIEELSRLSFPYITLQSWNEEQIERFCKTYALLTESKISEEAIHKMKEMKNVFGIPILLYMTLALEITVKDESSVVEVYDQVFSLEGGIYDRCLKKDASIRWDDKHRIAEIKKQIHQVSREISMWMFENNPEQAAIPKAEYEKLRDKVFEKNEGVDKSLKKDVLIGNYFRMLPCYEGVDTEELIFVHRSIYEYFVAETICSEIKEMISEMSEEAQEKIAGVLGYRLKKGKIDYTIGKYLKAKVSALVAAYSKEKKNLFYLWMEGAFGKMLDAGMLYYTGKNIKEYRNVIEKEMNCFLNVLDILRLLLNFSDREYILQTVNKEKVIYYVMRLSSVANQRVKNRIDLRRVDLRGAYLRGAYLLTVYFSRPHFSRVTGVDINEADLSAIDLGEAYLNGEKYISADLREADLSESYLPEAQLKSAYLRGTKLVKTVLRSANLREADLREADLREADLREADLREADLRGADLSKTNLGGADLDHSRWFQEDVDQYISFIKQAKFNMIYIYSKTPDKRRVLTRVELLSRHPD